MKACILNQYTETTLSILKKLIKLTKKLLGNLKKKVTTSGVCGQRE